MDSKISLRISKGFGACPLIARPWAAFLAKKASECATLVAIILLAAICYFGVQLVRFSASQTVFRNIVTHPRSCFSKFTGKKESTRSKCLSEHHNCKRNVPVSAHIPFAILTHKGHTGWWMATEGFKKDTFSPFGCCSKRCRMVGAYHDLVGRRCVPPDVWDNCLVLRPGCCRL